MMVPLPTHIDDPIGRLQAIHEVAVHTKMQHEAMGADLRELGRARSPLGHLGRIPAMSSLGLIRFAPPLFNLIISNVQGPPIDLYLAGAEVTATYPLGPLMGGLRTQHHRHQPGRHPAHRSGRRSEPRRASPRARRGSGGRGRRTARPNPPDEGEAQTPGDESNRG